MSSSLHDVSQPKWFAAYTLPRHERQVLTRLQERKLETFLPLYRSVREWKNRTRVSLELPLFPCYVFVRIGREGRGKVLSTAGIISLVGSKLEPWPLSDFEIETLKSGLPHSNPQPHEYLVAGERLRIRSGPLTGLEGILVRKKGSLRAVITIEQIGRSFSVEVNAGDLEPATNFLALVP